MFTKEALEHLESTLSAKNVTPVNGMAVIPDTHKLVSTEEFQLFRNRYRGELKTDSLNGFADYVNKFKFDSDFEQTQLYVDKKGMQARHFLTLVLTTYQGTATILPY